MRTLLVLLLFPLVSFGQFFKYSTFYTSFSLETSMVERDNYIAIAKGYEDVTVINPYDYNLTIGIRKIARFDYEYKVKTWYYGTERTVSDNVTIGNANGWEYLFNYSFIRHRGEKFNNADFWLRHVGTKTVNKLQYKDNERVGLEYRSIDSRYRISKGSWDFTLGIMGRNHPVYGITPIEDLWIPGEQTFAQLAAEFGYSTAFVNGNWHWYNNEELIATSNDEFYKHYFGDAVASFNERELEKLGTQNEISAVLGVSYYKWTPKLWIHVWYNLLPLHYGPDDYSFRYGVESSDWAEWDAGVVVGSRITKHLGLFVEGTHQRYWMIPVYEVKFGFNYLLF
mgnify:FL=1|tara:strand:+ start:1035 stop:2051 length:1017 start_codon:yes stop_codon:yes gene_type:complete